MQKIVKVVHVSKRRNCNKKVPRKIIPELRTDYFCIFYNISWFKANTQHQLFPSVLYMYEIIED